MPIGVGTQVTSGSEVFRIDRELSRGGFGVAYVAVQIVPPTGHQIVVKVPLPHVLQDPDWLARFVREARVLANIRHPNVVENIALWEFPSGEKALAQQFISDATGLTTFLTQPSRRPEDVFSLFLQCCYGIDAFHHSQFNYSIVHRDISPSNILVTAGGILKVIDFGLAKEDPRATRVLTVTGQWFGTPGCMAPEQIDSAADVDTRADLYALGRTFAAAMQGRNPQFADPRSLPEPWRTVLARLAEHSPDDRYGSIREARDTVFDFLSGSPLVLPNFEHHVHQLWLQTSPPGWAALCRVFLTSADLDASRLKLMQRMHSSVFSEAAFQANAVFDVLERSSAMAAFDSRMVTFDDADVLGDVLRGLYSSLDPPRRVAAFGRLVRIAVAYHRYHVMGLVRSVFGGETNAGLKTTLAAELERLDPHHVIEGRGVLPREP